MRESRLLAFLGLLALACDPGATNVDAALGDAATVDGGPSALDATVSPDGGSPLDGAPPLADASARDGSVDVDAGVIMHPQEIFYVSPTGSDGSSGSRDAPWATFAHAFSTMRGGDMLVLLAGEYAQSIGNWDWSGGERVDAMPAPPSGTPDAPTVIRAEVDGTVRVIGDPGGRRAVMFVTGEHIHIEGLTLVLREGGEGAQVALIPGSFIELRRNGFGKPVPSDVVIVGVSGHDVLIEDCWMWGSGRSGVSVGNTSDDAGGRDVTLRRLVIRLDSYSGRHEMLGVLLYGAKEVITENVVVLNFLTTSSTFEFKGGIRSRAGYGAVGHRTFGSLVLDNPYHGFLLARMDCTDCIAWDVGQNHFNEFGFSTEYALTDSTAGGMGGGIVVSGVATSDLLSGAATAGLSTILDGEGDGAQMLLRYQDGVLTDEPLWPWPNEGRIQADFAGFGGVDATRGFCADGAGLYGGPITLTSYLWEYLGTPCPASVCGL